jgi:serine protease
MGEMRRVALTIAALAIVVIAGGSVASALPAKRTPVTRAVVLVSTPRLPTGRSAADEARWRDLRSDSRQVLDRVAKRYGLRVEAVNPEIGVLDVEVGSGGLGALRADLADDPRIESVRQDVPVQLRYAPNDYAFTHPDVHAPNGDLGQWNLVREGGPRAWDLSKGVGAEVAVVDSGADGSHPDLAQRIVGSASFGTGSPPLSDTAGHGTHTAGLACGHADNGYGIASLGFNCGLFIAKEGGFCSDVANGITAAANRSSDVISISLGGCPPDPMTQALSYAQSRGAVLVVAADNSPTPNGDCFTVIPEFDCFFPEEWVQPFGTGPTTASDRGLVVTAARYDGGRASFAEMTTRVSVAAFGAVTDLKSGGQQGILSSWPANGVADDSAGGRTSLSGDSRFAYLVGTSMATPQVAGLAALIRAAEPGMANTRVVHLIKATASHCGSYSGGIGWGIIRADQAVAAALDRDIDPPRSHVRSARRLRRASLASTSNRGGILIRLRLKRKDPPGLDCGQKLPISGVKKIAVFASANGGPYRRIEKTKKDSLVFHAKRHRRYRFYSVAIDNAGNREAPPVTADAKLKR